MGLVKIKENRSLGVQKIRNSGVKKVKWQTRRFLVITDFGEGHFNELLIINC